MKYPAQYICNTKGFSTDGCIKYAYDFTLSDSDSLTWCVAHFLSTRKTSVVQ